MRFDGWYALLTGVVVVFALAGCASGGATTAGTATAVTAVASVAGKWTGLLEMEGSRDREDFDVLAGSIDDAPSPASSASAPSFATVFVTCLPTATAALPAFIAAPPPGIRFAAADAPEIAALT